jgi:hypothetical protein
LLALADARPTSSLPRRSQRIYDWRAYLLTNLEEIQRHLALGATAVLTAVANRRHRTDVTISENAA